MLESQQRIPEVDNHDQGRHLPLPASSDRGEEPAHGERSPPRGRPAPISRWLIRRVLQQAGVPARVVLWNGEEIAGGHGPPVATVHIRDRRTLWRLLAAVDPGFGDAYGEGRIEVEGSLVALLEAVFRARATDLRSLPGSWLLRLLARPRANSLKGSRSNIYHHYDVSNDFYRLWLDEQMVYTCAYFPTPEHTLEEAQAAKMDHVARKLQLRPGQTVIEAGCGWGALARHMARHYGVTVTAYNVSHQQIEYARERAKAEGLDGQVRYVEDDYRNISGTCDAFVSVGMLEHVGLANYRTLGSVISRVLKPAGRGLIHSIGRNRPAPTSPWLEKNIFPGAYIPSLREMMAVFEPWRFSVLDVENLRLHYARTLEHWLARFEAASGHIREMFEERFVRIWRMYLALSQAGFSAGALQLFQVVFAHGDDNEIPWTREHVYREEKG
jgi:cyclopropane-fatty-acyl-phospholipid synthase